MKLKMFLQVVLLSALVAFASSLPIEADHATSYVSTSFGGLGNLGGNNALGYGKHQLLQAPIVTHHEVSLAQHTVPVVHKVVAPIINKVPVYLHHVAQEDEEHGPAEYEFHYAVEDKHTGDIKSQKESRHGDQVVGEYSLKEADGTTRIVKYTADKKNGFNAVVIREGHSVHPQVEHKQAQVHKVVVPVKNVGVPVVQHHDSYQQYFSHY